MLSMLNRGARIRAGLQRARKFGRSPGRPSAFDSQKVREVIALPAKEAAATLGISARHFLRLRDRYETEAERAARAKTQPRALPAPKRQITDADILALPPDLTNKQAADQLGISVSSLIRWRRQAEESRSA